MRTHFTRTGSHPAEPDIFLAHLPCSSCRIVQRNKGARMSVAPSPRLLNALSKNNSYLPTLQLIRHVVQMIICRLVLVTSPLGGMTIVK